jgi:quercetin dioxygenase-like cupin family protein
MERAAFETRLREQGYDEAVDRQMAAGVVNPNHSHEFDAHLLILDGEITIERDGAPRTFRPGDTCEVPAGTPHAERVGAQGVRYLAGRRTPR